MHATLQQTPSAQKFDAQSLSFVQTALAGFLPQLPFAQPPAPVQSELL